MSFGQARSNERNDPESLISIADARLYMAKKSGKGRVCLTNGKMYMPNENTQSDILNQTIS